MSREKKFSIDFVGFATYGNSVEATVVVEPEFTLTEVIEMQYSKDSLRAINLIFRQREPKTGRRGYSLKQEWEQEEQQK